MKKRQKKRIQIEETVKYLGDFYGPLEHIIADLQSRLDDGWEGIETEYERDYYECHDHKVYYLYRHRPETDEEYEERIKRLEQEILYKEKEKLKEKEKRRQKYEQLKQEFGDV